MLPLIDNTDPEVVVAACAALVQVGHENLQVIDALDKAHAAAELQARGGSDTATQKAKGLAALERDVFDAVLNKVASHTTIKAAVRVAGKVL